MIVKYVIVMEIVSIQIYASVKMGILELSVRLSENVMELILLKYQYAQDMVRV